MERSAKISCTRYIVKERKNFLPGPLGLGQRRRPPENEGEIVLVGRGERGWLKPNVPNDLGEEKGPFITREYHSARPKDVEWF